MKLNSNLQSASIYIPHLKEWASITGACLEDGNFRLIWKTDSNKLGTMALDTVQELVKSFAVPF
jgi:hypothetical protein